MTCFFSKHLKNHGLFSLQCNSFGDIVLVLLCFYFVLNQVVDSLSLVHLDQ